MNSDLFAAFIVATIVLIIMPGPNILLIVSQSLRFGPKAGLTTVAGTSFAQAQQLVIVALGLTSFMAFLADWFEVLRWLGVAYLLFLGIQAFREKPETETPSAVNRTPGANARRFWQGFFVSWTNPKVLAFYVAFFPQFLDPTLAPAPQLWTMCVTFLVIAVVLDGTYALMAGRLGHRFSGVRAQRVRNRVTGGLLILAGLGLALVRKT